MSCHSRWLLQFRGWSSPPHDSAGLRVGWRLTLHFGLHGCQQARELVPDDRQQLDRVDAEVLMRHQVPQSGKALPIHLWVPLPDIAWSALTASPSSASAFLTARYAMRLAWGSAWKASVSISATMSRRSVAASRISSNRSAVVRRTIRTREPSRGPPPRPHAASAPSARQDRPVGRVHPPDRDAGR